MVYVWMTEVNLKYLLTRKHLSHIPILYIIQMLIEKRRDLKFLDLLYPEYDLDLYLSNLIWTIIVINFHHLTDSKTKQKIQTRNKVL